MSLTSADCITSYQRASRLCPCGSARRSVGEVRRAPPLPQDYRSSWEFGLQFNSSSSCRCESLVSSRCSKALQSREKGRGKLGSLDVSTFFKTDPWIENTSSPSRLAITSLQMFFRVRNLTSLTFNASNRHGLVVALLPSLAELPMPYNGTTNCFRNNVVARSGQKFLCQRPFVEL